MKFHLPTTMIPLVTIAVLNEGASVVTSQLKFPDKLKPTSRRNTCVAFDTDNCNHIKKLILYIYFYHVFLLLNLALVYSLVTDTKLTIFNLYYYNLLE